MRPFLAFCDSLATLLLMVIAIVFGLKPALHTVSAEIGPDGTFVVVVLTVLLGLCAIVNAGISVYETLTED